MFDWKNKMNSFLNETISRIKNTSDTPGLDAQTLLAHISGRKRNWVLAHPEMELKSGQQKRLASAILLLQSGVPLPYILGIWEFFGLELFISNDVLIPRSETELLVEKALEWLQARPQHCLMIDMGTGSGCIAIALAFHVKDLLVKAIDISKSALVIARSNAEKFSVAERMNFMLGDLWDQIVPGKNRFISTDNDLFDGRADLITANLPYIPTDCLHELKIYGKEPDLALDGGKDGLDVIQRFLRSAQRHLKPDGLILMEVEAYHGSASLQLAKQYFPKAKLQLRQDLSGKDRLIEIQQ
jgi:release factor glutamine methyltransferase